MSEIMYLTTPIGRMVQGHPLIENTKNMMGGQLTDKSGKPRSEYFFAIAISKQDPGVGALIAQAQAIAQQAFPGGQANQADFSWKIIDGDLPGNIEKEGFAGCYVFRCTNGWPPKCFTKGGGAQIVDQDQLKRGYFIRASISFKGNDDLNKPGIFVNCGAVELFSFGEEIQGGPDGAVIFGAQQPAYLPPGMTDAPVTTAPPLQQPAAGGFPPVQAQPPVQGGGFPPVQVAPAFPPAQPPAQGGGFPPGVAPQTQAPPPGAPGNFLSPPPGTMATAEPQPTPGYKMAPTAPGSYADFLKAGWNDQQLIQAGHLIINDIPH